MAKKKQDPQFKDELTRLFSQFAGNGKEGAVLVIQRPYLKLCRGDHLAALLLSQIMYWQERTSDPDGWFSHSYQEWENELGLSHYQIKRLISGEKRERKNEVFKLASVGVETKLKRSSHHKGAATIHYRCNWDVLSGALKGMMQVPVFDNVETPVFDNVENDIIDNVENVYKDYSKEYTDTTTYAPAKADAPRSPTDDDVKADKPKKERQRNPLFDAVAATVFGIPEGTPVTQGARIGKVVTVCKAHGVNADDLPAFVAWYKREYPNVSVPRDAGKLEEHLIKWQSTRKAKASQNGGQYLREYEAVDPFGDLRGGDA